MDGLRVLSGINYANLGGPMCKDAPAAHRPPETLHIRRERWSRTGLFAQMLIELAAEERAPAR